DWTRSFGGPASDTIRGPAVDASGNVYVTGSFSGTADFDPGVGTTLLTSSGGADGYVSKFDPAGTFVWARRMGGGSDDNWPASGAIALDAAGAVYPTGSFAGTATFPTDTGSGTASLSSSRGSPDVFVSKTVQLPPLLAAGGATVGAGASSPTNAQLQ